jgi:hypothetical protein
MRGDGPERHWLILLLSVALLFSLWRLVSWVVRFAGESLQMDLAAFYTAGEALNHGLSPYRNHAARDPAIWDGVDLFEHSRFLYPPQVAVLFRPLAWLPYAGAKRLWLALSLGCVAASLFLAGRVYGLGRRWALILTSAIGAALFYPLLTHLERGQIDALTLLLITLASVGMGRRTSRAELVAGVLLCAATLLKLHCVYMLPFLVIRSKGRVLLGYLGGGLLIAALTVVAPGGIKGALAYVTDELPRISRHGEWGTDEMRLPETILAQRLQGLSDGATIKGGVVYKRESFSFVSNGTLVRVLQRRLQKAEIWISNSLLSALVLVVLFGAMVAWQFRLPGPLHLDARGEILYWQVIALIVLLSAPLTWVMNLVWLLPLIVVVLAELSRPGDGWGSVALVLAAVALVVIALPDGLGSRWMTPALARLIRDKYVVGEGLLLLSLLGYVPRVLENRDSLDASSQ